MQLSCINIILVRQTKNLQKIKQQLEHTPLTITQLRKTLPEIEKSIVYRTIQRMLDENMIAEIQLPNGELAYELLNTQHYHLICEQCNQITCVDAPRYLQNALKAFESEINKNATVTNTMLNFFITCKHCKLN